MTLEAARHGGRWVAQSEERANENAETQLGLHGTRRDPRHTDGRGERYGVAARAPRG
jgi:hypothetical protein